MRVTRDPKEKNLALLARLSGPSSCTEIDVPIWASKAAHAVPFWASSLIHDRTLRLRIPGSFDRHNDEFEARPSDVL